MRVAERPSSRLLVAALPAALVFLAAAAPPRPGATARFTLQSAAFRPGATIPARFTCDGADASPVLSWTDPPAGATTFALVVDDPDAPRGVWTHWLLWDLPATARRLPEGVATATSGPEGAIQGTNDFRRPGYGGPCPPPGSPHRYVFRVLALDGPLGLRAGADRAAFDKALSARRVLGAAELMGRYARGG